MEIFGPILIIWIGLAVACGAVANGKGRSAVGWGFLGLLGGIFGILPGIVVLIIICCLGPAREPVVPIHIQTTTGEPATPEQVEAYRKRPPPVKPNSTLAVSIRGAPPKRPPRPTRPDPSTVAEKKRRKNVPHG